MRFGCSGRLLQRMGPYNKSIPVHMNAGLWGVTLHKRNEAIIRLSTCSFESFEPIYVIGDLHVHSATSKTSETATQRFGCSGELLHRMGPYNKSIPVHMNAGLWGVTLHKGSEAIIRLSTCSFELAVDAFWNHWPHGCLALHNLIFISMSRWCMKRFSMIITHTVIVTDKQERYLIILGKNSWVLCIKFYKWVLKLTTYPHNTLM